MSDQDFFFDEDEQPKAESSAPAKKASAGKSAPAAAAPAAAGVSTTVAALIGVIALLAGLIVGILLPIGGAAPATTSEVSSPAGTTAPQLTQEQMQGGELPAGHPDIGALSGESSSSAESTGK